MNAIATPTQIETTIATTKGRIEELTREREALALSAATDAKAAARMAKLRVELSELEGRHEDLRLALATAQHAEREAQRQRAAEERRQLRNQVCDEIAALIPIAESIDEHLEAAGSAYRELLARAASTTPHIPLAGLTGRENTLAPLRRLFHLRSAIWHSFGEDLGEMPRVSNAQRRPLAQLVRDIAKTFTVQESNADKTIAA